MSADIAVSISGVGKSFASRRGRVVALDGIDLEIRSGEFLTLFGPSGCGKSTLLRVIAGLEETSVGTVRVLGDAPAVASAHKNIAWVPQSPGLLPWSSVLGNAALSARVNRRADRRGLSDRRPEDARAVLGELGLSEFLNAPPAQLSGGMRQRAAIARGFVQGSPLLLMDEPFSALDELTRDTLRLKLLELWQRHRRTVVFVTHSAAEAVLLSDRVVVMTPRPGRIHDVIDVGLDRPRDAAMTESPEFARAVARVKRALGRGWDGGEQ
ncbi:MAG: ABC transporter ATP-binding protein [Microbacteriaceae bacterium]